MAENSAYFDSIVATRAMLLDDQESLEGQTLISLESQADMAEEDILTYIQENFAGFIRILRSLKKEDQELLLSYYLLSKTQNTLATIHKSTQTVCSFRIRMAVKTLGTFIMMGGAPTVEKMHEVLAQAGLEDSLVKIDLSKVVDLYVKTRNFQKIAELHHLHRPDIRRAMSRASKQLMESKDPQEHALGAYIHNLIDKANPAGQGYSKRKIAKQCHIYRTDPSILGEFRISVSDPDFQHMFVSRANR
jgi:hypothetical protein